MIATDLEVPTMMVRTSLLSFFFALLLAAPASSQMPPPPPPPGTGSITIMSRPDRASFRLQGDIKVVGRTPMTFARGLTGPYRITGFEIGYNNWNRRIVLDGVSADTIWMSLSRKHGISAGMRSLVVPGWGQFYDENKGRGWFFMLSWLGAGITLGFAQVEYMDRQDELNAVTTPEQYVIAEKRFEDAQQFRNIMLGVEAGIYVVSFFEAIASVPEPVGAVLLGTRVEVRPGAAGTPADVAVLVPLAHVKF
jgi:hypothetical protein